MKWTHLVIFTFLSSIIFTSLASSKFAWDSDEAIWTRKGMYFHNNKDYLEAVKWYTKAAEQGFHGAQQNLGNAYFLGMGVKKDIKEAVKWYTKAAEQGNDGAQYNLGNAYFLGMGVKKDIKEAVKWYTKATEQGNLDAGYRLASSLFTGKGVTKDREKAVSIFTDTAHVGHEKSQKTILQLATAGLRAAQSA